MATYTYKEIAEKFAQKIRNGAKQTELKESSSVTVIKEAFSKRDPILEALKSIKNDLDGYVYSETKKPLSEDDKRDILKQAGEILGLSKPADLIYIVKEASNENAIALLTYISQFINDLKVD